LRLVWIQRFVGQLVPECSIVVVKKKPPDVAADGLGFDRESALFLFRRKSRSIPDPAAVEGTPSEIAVAFNCNRSQTEATDLQKMRGVERATDLQNLGWGEWRGWPWNVFGCSPGAAGLGCEIAVGLRMYLAERRMVNGCLSCEPVSQTTTASVRSEGSRQQRLPAGY
jgi:hypothetical protein